jgi:hypothetical protein
MAITYDAICDAVADTIDTIAAITTVQKYDALQEGYADMPLAQVYIDSGETDVMAGTADRSAFRGGARVTETVVVVDIPCRQRSHIDQDMKAIVDVIEAVQNKLETIDTKPYFGLVGIQGFRWRWERVVFEKSGVFYPGTKFYIYVRTF